MPRVELLNAEHEAETNQSLFQVRSGLTGTAEGSTLKSLSLYDAIFYNNGCAEGRALAGWKPAETQSRILE